MSLLRFASIFAKANLTFSWLSGKIYRASQRGIDPIGEAADLQLITERVTEQARRLSLTSWPARLKNADRAVFRIPNHIFKT